ncbi:hypothetical protein MBLNU457_5952t1 [Dothideomycetes sp. NU457]
MRAIEVFLEKPDTYLYTPGEAVRGVAKLRITSQEKIHDVVASFRGDIETVIYKSNGNNRRRYSEEINLFAQQKVLFQGPFTLQPQTLEFPFEFIFPEESYHERKFEKDDSGRFQQDSRGRLPPQFIHDGSDHCNVSYGVSVTINASKLFRKEHVVKPLFFSPVSDQPTERTTSGILRLPHARWQSRSLRPEEVKHTFKQTLQRVFNDNPELRHPSINFDVELSLPNTLSSGSALQLQECEPRPVSLSLRYTRTGPTDPEEPTLRLHSLKLRIRGHIAWRCSRALVRSTVETAKEDNATMLFTTTGSSPTDNRPIHVPLDGTPITIIPDLRLLDFAPGPNFGVPDFSTYTISLQHDIKACVQIEHVESGHLFVLEESSIPFCVRPQSRPKLPQYDVPPLVGSERPPPIYETNGPPQVEKKSV